jgi:hypothetical protein
MEIDNKLDNRMMTLKEKTKEVEIMKETVRSFFFCTILLV